MDDDLVKPILDREAILKLCALQASNDEIAAYFKVNVEIIEEFYRDLVFDGRNRGLINIRQWQMEKAQAGDVEMLKWLGQQYLRQSPHNK